MTPELLDELLVRVASHVGRPVRYTQRSTSAAFLAALERLGATVFASSTDSGASEPPAQDSDVARVEAALAQCAGPLHARWKPGETVPAIFVALHAGGHAIRW